ncbi:MAG: lycopene cyclase family protein [Pelobium sp.]
MQNSSTTSFYNFTIVGAGASGLWLANAMIDNGLLINKTLCIVESDNNKTNDRTWCYWAKENIKEPKIVSKEWRSIKDLYGDRNNQIFPYKYYHVKSNDFYRHLKTKLTQNPNICWKVETVNTVDKLTEGKLCVQTINQSWETDYAFLAALPAKDKDLETNKLNLYLGSQGKKIFMWQSFVGYRIKTNAPVFNPSEIAMMDFNADQANATQFFYELPFSENEALIEFTRFGTEIIDDDYAISQIENRLKSKNISYQILEIEKGAIPMTPQFDQHNNSLSNNQNIIYIGTLGGAIKPTTGYGFKRMFDYAEELAKALKNENKSNLPTMKRKWRFRVYDIILIQILLETPNLGKNIFQTLFTNQPIKRILKFLDEETSIIEEVKIFYRLPLLPFTKSLLKYLFVR